MKNKIITFTQAELDTGNQLRKVTSLSGEDSPTIKESSPNFISFINGTGKILEVNLLSKRELAEYNNDATNFVGMAIANGGSFNSILLGIDPEKRNEPIDYILIKKSEVGSTSADLTVYCINYT